MKSILLLAALIVLFSGCLSAQSDNPDVADLQQVTFLTSLESALEAAKGQEKPVFVYFRSESCGWCRKFEEETFTNQSVIDELNENFILVSIDVNKQKNETRSFKVRGTPAMVFLDSRGTEIKRIPGYTDTGTFFMVINTIAQSNKREDKNGQT